MEGHEIACHGYSHKLVYEQAPRSFVRRPCDPKGILEDITGESVAGYRAASYSITPKSRWALDILVEAGFVYDSSIFPVRHDLYGMPGAERFPHVLETTQVAPAGRVSAEYGTPVRAEPAGGRWWLLSPLSLCA
jgi:peptidoglycan/xylan/chitin deacetylase (PgdA/CDA1 family)